MRRLLPACLLLAACGEGSIAPPYTADAGEERPPEDAAAAATNEDAAATNADAAAPPPKPLPKVVIDEIMYHPPDRVAAGEFVELVNADTATVALAGWRLGGFGFTFPAGASLAPGARAVIAESAGGFRAAYGFDPDFAGMGHLSNGGEELELRNGQGLLVDRVAYLDVPPWPVTPDGLGPSLELIDPSFDNAEPKAWRASTDRSGSTPKRPNAVAQASRPPWVASVRHTVDPEPLAPIEVTAEVEEASDVVLSVKIGFDPPTQMPMTASGGTYRATVPGRTAGTLVRLRVEARGPGGAGTWPRADDTVRWGGTVVSEPVLVTALPLFQWFMSPDAFQRAKDHRNTDELEPCVFYYGGVLHDASLARIKGNVSRTFPKNHWKIHLPQGHDFFHPEIIPTPIDQFDLESSYADKSFVRDVLAFETLRDGGLPSNYTRHVRLHQNGEFFGLYTFLEDMDRSWLARNGLDPEGSWYEALSDGSEDTLPAVSRNYEKATREDEDASDLTEMLRNVNHLSGRERRDWLFDNFDVPGMANYLALMAIIHNNDHVGKNYYLYRDTNGTRRWTMHAWDLDLSFGRNFGAGGGNVLVDGIWADDDRPDPSRPWVSPSHPLFGDREHQKWDNLWNKIIDAFLSDPDLRAMYHRRLRTLADQLLTGDRYARRIAELQPLIENEAVMDVMVWGQYGEPQDLRAAARLITDEYLPRRRRHFFVNHRVPGEIPEAQSARPAIVIDEIMYAPGSAGGGEFVELYNPSSDEAVDVSGWSIAAFDLVVPAGTVILPGGYAVIAKDDYALRQARGVRGRFVIGGARGLLDDGGEPIVLLDRAGETIDQVTYGARAPWPTTARGGGYSLELVSPSSDNALAGSWAASRVPGGTPGAKNSVAP